MFTAGALLRLEFGALLLLLDAPLRQRLWRQFRDFGFERIGVGQVGDDDFLRRGRSLFDCGRGDSRLDFRRRRLNDVARERFAADQIE